MLQITINAELEKHLADIAARVGEAPEELARKALLAYLEDLEDYAAAVEAERETGPDDWISGEEIMARYGLEG